MNHNILANTGKLFSALDLFFEANKLEVYREILTTLRRIERGTKMDGKVDLGVNQECDENKKQQIINTEYWQFIDLRNWFFDTFDIKHGNSFEQGIRNIKSIAIKHIKT